MNNKLTKYPYNEITVERDGGKYRGGYRIKPGKFPQIIVSYGGQQIVTLLGGMSPEVLAESLIMEMVNKEKIRKAEEAKKQNG